MFRGETSGSPLSSDLLRAKVIYFVNRADPNGNLKVHQLRKVATSLNFTEYFDFEALKQYTGWKSPRVFYKHYLLNIGGAPTPAVAAGKVIHPHS